jgi:hypothetical protein
VRFADASRIDLQAFRRDYTVPAPSLRIGLPFTIITGNFARSCLVVHDIT